MSPAPAQACDERILFDSRTYICGLSKDHADPSTRIPTPHESHKVMVLGDERVFSGLITLYGTPFLTWPNGVREK